MVDATAVCFLKMLDAWLFLALILSDQDQNKQFVNVRNL